MVAGKSMFIFAGRSTRITSSDLMEVHQRISDACCVKVVIVPVGPVPDKKFQEYTQMLRKHSKIELQEVSAQHLIHVIAPDPCVGCR